MLAGVAAGLARRLDVPTWLIRAAFVILAFAGGFGVALYAAGWLLIPEEHANEPLATSLAGRVKGIGGWIGIALIVVAALIITDSVWFLRGDVVIAAILIAVGVLLFRGEIGRTDAGSKSGIDNDIPEAPEETDGEVRSNRVRSSEKESPVRPARPRSALGRITFGLGVIAVGVMAMAEYASAGFDPSPRHYLGLFLGVIGLGLLVGTFFGRARGLIVLGVLITPLVVLSPIADMNLSASIGQRIHNPATFSEIRPGYRLGAGSLIVDLSGLEFTGQEVEIDAQVGLGELRVYVPRDVAVKVRGRIGIGDFDAFGYGREGVGASFDHSIEGSNGRIELDTRVGAGELRVIQGSMDGDRLEDVGYVIEDPEQLQPSYSLASGTLMIDLSLLELDEERKVFVSVGTGELYLTLPENTATMVSASLGAGELILPDGRRLSGLGIDETFGPTEPVVDIEIEVGAGDIFIEGADK